MANDVLGYAPCGCGKKKQVMQAKRKGDHLYSRCDDCGLDQRTGARVQQKLWDSAEWIDEPPTPPENVDITVKVDREKVAKPSSDKVLEDFDLTVNLTESKPKTKAKGRILPMLGSALVIAGVGVAIWKA